MDVQPTTDNKSAPIICGICGSPHKISTCNVIRMKLHMQDNILPSKARLTLPNTLRLETMSEGSNAIVALDIIKRGTRFGPFEAKRIFTLNPEISFPLKIFTANDYFSEYYLDTSNENECNWMMFVPPAQNISEQNLICYQDNLKIYFMSIRDIPQGEFLKVWYSPFYAQKMDKNVLAPAKVVEKVFDLNTLLKKQQNLMEQDIWMCKFCNIQEKDVTKFAKHILQHYSMQVRKACEICKSVFVTHKGLKRHIRIVHANKISEQKETVPSIKSIGHTKDSMLGGPLLNDVLTDSMDNTNLLLHQTDITRFDPHNMENNLLDNDNLNLTVDNFIEDDDDKFNFNIDEDKDEYVCDICLKPFVKLKRLVQHLQKHTGKYTCSECLVIFSRNENLQAHKCNLHKKEQYKCTLCQKKFALKKYLSRHIQAVHERKKSCPKCNKSYHCDKEYREHNCSGVPDSEKEKYPCLLCNKTFFRESYIKKHMKLHAPIKESEGGDELFICEICAKTFKTSRNLKRHKRTHSQLSYPCDKCDKSFTRSDTLNHHVIVEHSQNSYPCPICAKVSKSKKYLRLHMNTHSTRKKFQCTACNRKFFQKSAMLKHFKLKHAVQCNKCDQADCDHAKTLIECYECPLCQKLLKLRSSVVRHLKKTHNYTQVDTRDIKKVVRMWHVPDTTLKEDSLKDNHEDNLDNIALEDFNRFNTIEQPIVSNDSNLIDLNNLTLELERGGVEMNNDGICLSMPELSEMDHDVTLSDNAYVLDNGTIIEPLDSENVVVYVFDKQE